MSEETPREIRIASRFCGPKRVANGGYVSGLIGRLIDGPTEVTLRRPPPLERGLRVVAGQDGVELYDGDELIAGAVAAPLHLEVPEAPSRAEAEAASARYPGRERHPFPGCFVCGTERNEGDGLRLFPGPVAGRENLVAGPWYCDESLGDAQGLVRPEFVCAALDCPGHWAGAQPGEAAVLVRFQIDMERVMQVGESAVSAGWLLARSDRRYETGTAVFDLHGHLVARARAIWRIVDPERFAPA